MLKTANVGPADRILRIIVGLALIAAPYFTSFALWDNTAIRWAAPIVGIILVLTALVRFCPLYRLTGMNTCKVE